MPTSSHRPRLAFAVTHPTTANVLLRGQLRFLATNGFDVTVISSSGPELEEVREREGVRVIGLEMSRAVRLQEGPRTLRAMLGALRAARPDILNASTPKAALLALLAARYLRIPRRIYLVRGLRLEGAHGAARSALALAERVTSRACNEVVCVSESLQEACERASLLSRRPTTVIPSNGVDCSRFLPRAQSAKVRASTRVRFGIPLDSPVIGFVGRLVPDKGIEDLIQTIATLRADTAVHVLVVGGDLAGDALPRALEARLEALPRVHYVGRVDAPELYYPAMDVLLFPSRREGLPNVPLEAAACEVPTVGYRVTGVRDAVSHGTTGLLSELDDRTGLRTALETYLGDESRRAAHGAAARARVLEGYEQRSVWQRWLNYYGSVR